MTEEIPDYAHTGDRPPGWELKNNAYQPSTISDFDFAWRFGRRRHCADDNGGMPHAHCPKCGQVMERHVGGVSCEDADASGA
jgi:hypothetical protein